MSLAAPDVRAPSDVFRCIPYRQTITGAACVSKQRAALDGTKSLAECIGCVDGACVAEALGAADTSKPFAAEPDELTATEPARPPDEPKETVAMPTTEERRAKQREYQRQYWLRKKAKLEGNSLPVSKRPAKQKSPKAIAATPTSQRSLTEIATLLGIDVDALLRREIASVLGLEQP